jgi:putative two-component system response regulator
MTGEGPRPVRAAEGVASAARAALTTGAAPAPGAPASDAVELAAGVGRAPLAGDPLRAEWPASILIADDDPAALRILRRVLEGAGYVVLEATDGDEVRSLLAETTPDLLILDIAMPGTDGIELSREVKSHPATCLIPVVHVTGYTSRAERIAALEAGSDEFVAKPFDLEELLTRVRSLLRTRRLTAQLVSAEAVLVALARTVEARDLYTERHLLRVAERAVTVAQALGVSPTALEAVRLGGLLHDLGKIAVPDRVLLKRGSLTRREYDLVKTHPSAGAEIVRPLGSFSAPGPVVLHHHERFDGAGYPHGLHGDSIPLAARIVAVADAFDAMTTDRPYRASLPVEEAFQRLRDGRASQWDPETIDAFLSIYGGTTDVNEDGEGSADGQADEIRRLASPQPPTA